LHALRENLAASDGIKAVLHEDREVFHLRVDGLDVYGVGATVNAALERTDTDD
jgi:hypothetical protein